MTRTRAIAWAGAVALAAATVGATLWRADSTARLSSAHRHPDLEPEATTPPADPFAGSSPLATAVVASSAPLRPAPPLDEDDLMTAMRNAEGPAPERALELARDGNRRFPDGPGAAERAAAVVRSLARLGRLSEARGEAEIMVNRYVGTPWALEVERHTGAHPHRSR